MDHLKEYGCLFDQAVTTDQHAEISSFATEAMLKVAAKDSAWCTLELNKLAASLEDPEVLCDVLQALDHSNHPVATGIMRKIADNAGLTGMDKFNVGMGVAGIGLALAPMISSIFKRKQAAKAADMNFHGVMSNNAHFRSDPMMSKYHDTIKRFSPAVASDPVLLENTLAHLQAMGPAGLTIGAVKDMAELSHSDKMSSNAPNHLSGLSGALEGAKTIRGVYGDAAGRITPGEQALKDISDAGTAASVKMHSDAAALNAQALFARGQSNAGLMQRAKDQASVNMFNAASKGQLGRP